MGLDQDTQNVRRSRMDFVSRQYWDAIFILARGMDEEQLLECLESAQAIAAHKVFVYIHGEDWSV